MFKESLETYKSLSGKERTKFVVNKAVDNALYILVAMLIVFVVIYNPRFISATSIINILTLSSTRLVMALGIAGCVVLTGTDLSAGRLLGLTACISASLLQVPGYAAKMYPNLTWLPQNEEASIIFQLLCVMVLVMLVSATIGFVNGFSVAKFKLHPFIVTLGTQLIVYGLSLIYVTFGENAGAPIGGIDNRYTDFVIGNIFGDSSFYVPWIIIYAVVVSIIMWFIWNKTVFGKNMFAVGCNEEAAKVSGVSVFWTIIMVFTLAGAMYGLAGFLESARVGSNTAATGNGYELDAIAACVIGGVSFTGGVGKIRGVIVGVILLQIINAALIFLDVPGSITYIVRGGIILVACAIDMRKYLTKK